MWQNCDTLPTQTAAAGAHARNNRHSFDLQKMVGSQREVVEDKARFSQADMNVSGGNGSSC